MQALGLVNCIVFRQSFNRPNLWQVSKIYELPFYVEVIICFLSKLKTFYCAYCRYSVIPKTKKCMDGIDKFIKENHYDECGIIYCLSRMDCEKVAEKLQVQLCYDYFVVEHFSLHDGGLIL